LDKTPGLTSLTDIVEEAERICKNCKPLTPIACITECKNWKIKNEFKKMYAKAREPNFMHILFNTLKNKRRLEILEMISNEQHAITRIQHELQNRGFNHSQQTISHEYLQPLLETGLVSERRNSYIATVFGQRTSDLSKDFRDNGELLSPHSECHEEIALSTLMEGPKTHEDLEKIIPQKNLTRVLSRLQKAQFISVITEKDYIFFFRTKRDPNISELSQTEKRVYDAIPEGGISARKLAREAGICVRKTYKYLRRLKGKKLVFTRKKPPMYTISARGARTGKILEDLRHLVADVLTASSRLNESFSRASN
jgi:predicted transcriptional regulator